MSDSPSQPRIYINLMGKGLHCKPSIHELNRMSVEQQKKVKDFTVYRVKDSNVGTDLNRGI